MNGTKASFFYNVAKRKKYSYLSMDLRGHGLSSGVFNQLSVKDWYQDLDELIKFLKVKQIVIVGSSMGGWLAINYTLLNPSKIIKLIGLAPAPDFTELLLWKNFSDSIKKKIMTKGTHKTKDGRTAKKGLWYNIAMKKKRGEKMRKKGDKGAPTAKAIKRSQKK